MPRFAYKARNGTGTLVTGVLDAASENDAAGDLVGQSFTPIQIWQVENLRKKNSPKPERSTMEKLNTFLAGKKIPLDDLIVFARQMYSLMRAGIPLDRALSGLQASLKNQIFRAVLQDVLVGLESGQDLATALSRHPKVFSPLFLSLVSVGENTGRLDMAFQQIGKYLELEKSTRKQVKSATRYPMFVIVTIAVALAVISVFVIPAFASTFERLGAELPIQTRILIAISDFFVKGWPYLIGGCLFIFFSVRRWLATPQGRLSWDHRKMQLPLAGPVFERIALSRFTRSFAMIMKAGVPLVHGLSVVAGAVGNAWVGKRVLGMQDGISRGESLYRTALNSRMFSPMVLQMIAVGEESGNLDELMEEVADFYDAEVEYDLKRLGEAIEPILIVIIAGMVLVLALGVFLPIWDLSSAANR